MSRLKLFPLGVLGVVLAVSTVHSAVVPLTDLLNGGTIQSGDKIFSNFKYTKDPAGQMPEADAINVEDITAANGDVGIRIQGGFTDLAGGSSSDAIVEFDVTVAPGAGMAINGVTLSANPAVFNGTGLASITETFLPDVADNKLVVYDFGNGDDKLSDSITFDQTFQTLKVQKDIILHATDVNSAVTLSFVDQTFSQVPEPSAALLAIAGGTLGLMIRRRRLA